jgi:hypothetical protein
MHKINLGALKIESLRGTEGEREEKGKKFIKKVRKGKIKKHFFFNSQKKKLKKLLGVPWHPQPLTWLRHCSLLNTM